MLLRLFAPLLPFVTEEVWSWWRYGSVHRAPWPTTYELDRVASGGDPAVLRVTSEALRQVRRAKSERRLSMRTEVPPAEVLTSTSMAKSLSSLWSGRSRAVKIAPTQSRGRATHRSLT